MYGLSDIIHKQKEVAVNQLLNRHFNHDTPFGPIDASEIEPEVMDQLFDKHNRIYEEMRFNPTMIIGRRGAGKTSFLKSALLEDGYQMIIDIPSHTYFREVVESIEEIGEKFLFVEEISEIWNMLLWHCVFVVLSTRPDEDTYLELLKDYLKGIGLVRRRNRNPVSVMKQLVGILKEHMISEKVTVISEIMEEIPFNQITFSEAREAASQYLEINDIQPIILLDTLENFRLEEGNMQLAISGLLKCQGEFEAKHNNCRIRCCLPSELYHIFLSLSSNPNKDFRRKLMIQWHAGELIKLGAFRFLNYLEVKKSPFYENQNRYNLTTRFGLNAFWNKLMPNVIRNRAGQLENTIAYILRHTQLLPRHFIMYLNAIGQKSRVHFRKHGQYSAKAITEGILETEEVICREILSAYKYVHPNAYKLCEATIPHLPIQFDDGELHQVYNRHVKGTLHLESYLSLRRILIEIGAVGRVKTETDRYIVGEFEYTVPHKLVVSSYEKFCLHPIFLEVFSARRIPTDKPIYPYGSDIEELDHRYHHEENKL